MALVSSKQLLMDAQNGGYAVAAFNIENIEMAQAVITAAQELQAPVILQTTPSTVQYASPELYFSIAASLAQRADVPICIHLDHGNSFEIVMQALRAGYRSVMIDGSHLPLDENIRLTKQVVQTAGACGVPVEAELGRIPGKEDAVDSEAGDYTDPLQAKAFVEQTNISSLAVAIGTAHGIYAKTPRLDIERLKEIRRQVEIPLVLHGASGLSEQDIRACLQAGICKVNFATELRIAFTQGVRGSLENGKEVFDPKVYGKAGRDAVKEVVGKRMALCGCIEKYR